MTGIGVVLRPDMVQKLNLNEDQMMQIQQILNTGRQASRQNQRAYGELMRSAFPTPANNNQNGAGGNSGRGRGRPNFRDPAVQEAMKTFMEKPETKAKLDQMKTQNEKIQDQIVSSVYRVLTKRQASGLKKLFGPPFDMSKLSGNPNAQAGDSPENAESGGSGQAGRHPQGDAQAGRRGPAEEPPRAARPGRLSVGNRWSRSPARGSRRPIDCPSLAGVADV